MKNLKIKNLETKNIFVRFQKGFIFSEDDLLRAPKRAPIIHRWVSDAYPKIGQLGQFVVFRTKSGGAKGAL